MKSANFTPFLPFGNKKIPENWILLFQFAENKVSGSVNQRIQKIWP